MNASCVRSIEENSLTARRRTEQVGDDEAKPPKFLVQLATLAGMIGLIPDAENRATKLQMMKLKRVHNTK